jgi:ferredoxin/flavodoxin---NADP+ reductase
MSGDNATIVEKIELDPTLAIFRIRPDAIPPASLPWFLPGQYVAIGTGGVERAYSIASAPSERRWLEFLIRFAREPATVSPFTHLLWKMPAGARLHIGEKIAGRFTLERTSPAGDRRVKLLVASGTGLAPFASMVRHRRSSGGATALAGIVVLHGASHPHELAYREELADAATRYGLGYVPTISRPQSHPDWTGATGRVETLLDDGRVPSVELHPDRTAVYVCGFRDTIAGTLRRLLGRGFIPEDRRLRRMLGVAGELEAGLFFEQYDLEPIFGPSDAALIASLRDSHGG